LAHPLLNSGFWLDGCAVSATDTSEADPFLAETCTTYPAVWPGLMLDCERWTLTHSSGGAVVPVPPLPLVAGLGSELGLVAARASSVEAAVRVAVAEDVAVAVPVALAVAVPVALDVPEADVEGDGEVVLLDPALTLAGDGNTLGRVLAVAEWFADGLLELVDGDGEGDGEGDGDREGDGDGDGEGVGVPEAGSAWHTVSVLAVVVRGAACAVPSTPRVKKLPLSKVTAATLTCAKRIKNRLSTLLVRVTVCSS
jgi:hypothetical protein